MSSFKEYLVQLEEAKKPHDDTEEDKALIKKMVKPDALKEDELDEGALRSVVLGAARVAGKIAGKLGGKPVQDAAKEKLKKMKQDDENGMEQLRQLAARKLRGESVEDELVEATVKSEKYSWGTMKTVVHGADFSIPLHPEHHKPIHALKDGESHSFTDETKTKWTATRKGDKVQFKGNTGTTSIPHAALKESEEVVENSPFDWKNKKSEIDWTGDKEKATSASGGTVHKARTTARNAEGGELEKRGRGRPKGDYGSYKIDKAKRDDPEYKKQLSQKVMAAKAENFKVRKEFKDSMNDAIKKHQLKLAGLDK